MVNNKPPPPSECITYYSPTKMYFCFLCLRMLSNFTNVIMTLFMINETARFDEATRDRLYNQLVFPQRIIFLMGILVVAMGILLWIGFLVICGLYRRSSLDVSWIFSLYDVITVGLR